MTSYIEWDSETQEFKPATSGRPRPPHPSVSTWWTSTSNTTGSRAAAQVTHLGDRSSAEYRAQVNQAFNAKATGLFGVKLPVDLAVLGEIYLENDGEKAMQAFGQSLLDSDADAAYYWNKKEAWSGAWSLILRRDFLGELPAGAGSRVRLLSQFLVSSVHPVDNGLPRIVWK